MKTVLIVGAGLAGARCAETLRSEGFEGRILLVGEEPVPTVRAPCSLEATPGRHTRARRSDPQASRVLGSAGHRPPARPPRVTDRPSRKERPARGRNVDRLGLARPRHGSKAAPARPGRHAGGCPLASDARRRARLPRRAAARRSAGHRRGGLRRDRGRFDRTRSRSRGLADPLRPPLAGVLGREISELLAARCEARGVELRTGVSVASLAAGSAGRVRAVVLEDGREVPCDAVLVGIGAAPAGELLPGRPAAGGVVTDGFGRTELPGVYACGDVANAWRPWLGAPLRVEHWTGAASQGVAVARAILGREESPTSCPTSGPISSGCVSSTSAMPIAGPVSSSRGMAIPSGPATWGRTARCSRPWSPTDPAKSGFYAGRSLRHAPRWQPKNSFQNDASSLGRDGCVRCKDAGSPDIS